MSNSKISQPENKYHTAMFYFITFSANSIHILTIKILISLYSFGEFYTLNGSTSKEGCRFILSVSTRILFRYYAAYYVLFDKTSLREKQNSLSYEPAKYLCEGITNYHLPS
jgi:hypothetical protein